MADASNIPDTGFASALCALCKAHPGLVHRTRQPMTASSPDTDSLCHFVFGTGHEAFEVELEIPIETPAKPGRLAYLWKGLAYEKAIERAIENARAKARDTIANILDARLDPEQKSALLKLLHDVTQDD